MDVAFLVWHHPSGDVGVMCILHVDDVMIATDSSVEAEAQVETFRAKYDFGEWRSVADEPDGVQYTGRTIKVDGDQVLINQEDFIDGRIEKLPITRGSTRADDVPCTPDDFFYL